MPFFYDNINIDEKWAEKLSWTNEIMESTIYNIISEAIYGEADLSEKTLIHFFNK